MKPVLLVIWILSHPVAFFITRIFSRIKISRKGEKRLNVISQIGSWVFGIFFVSMFFWRSKPRWLSQNEMAQIAWWISGPLCCFFTGLAYGMRRETKRLIPLTYVILVVGVIVFIIAVISVVSLLFPVGFGPP